MTRLGWLLLWECYSYRVCEIKYRFVRWSDIWHIYIYQNLVFHICCIPCRVILSCVMSRVKSLRPCHHLNQCWVIVDWAIWNKLLWNFNGYSNILIQENAFENVVCEMRPFWLGLNMLNRFNTNICHHEDMPLVICSLLNHNQPSTLWHKPLQIPKLKCLLFRLAVVFSQSLKPSVKSGMKIKLWQRRQAVHQLHLSDQQFYFKLRCVMYYSLNEFLIGFV